jgi:hypothetical protein
MDFLFERFTYIFDPLHHFWEHERMHQALRLGTSSSCSCPPW